MSQKQSHVNEADKRANSKCIWDAATGERLHIGRKKQQQLLVCESLNRVRERTLSQSRGTQRITTVDSVNLTSISHTSPAKSTIVTKLTY